MLFPTKALVIASFITIFTSCATIVSKSRYPVTVNSSPTGANVTITDRNGQQVFTGQTPSLVRLKSGDDFFRRAKYTVQFSKDGYATKTVEIHATVNGWYWGNLVFGGLIGFLIVDPATGAMYKLRQLDVNETLNTESKTAAASQTPQLRIYDINNIPESWKSKLVAIK